MKESANKKIILGSLGIAIILLGLILIISYFGLVQYQNAVTNLVYIYLGAVFIYVLIRAFQTFKNK